MYVCMYVCMYVWIKVLFDPRMSKKGALLSAAKAPRRDADAADFAASAGAKHFRIWMSYSSPLKCMYVWLQWWERLWIPWLSPCTEMIKVIRGRGLWKRKTPYGMATCKRFDNSFQSKYHNIRLLWIEIRFQRSPSSKDQGLGRS